MKLATDAESDAAKAFLDEWFPGHSVGQWAAFAEFLANRDAAVPPAPALEPTRKPRTGTYVYLTIKPGDETHGSPTQFYAPDSESAGIRARGLEASLGATLKYVGMWLDPTSERHRRFECWMPYDDAPEWARSWLDEQNQVPLAKTKRKGKAA